MSSIRDDIPQVNLERPCSDDHLAMIAKELVRWEEVAEALGLSQTEAEEIGITYKTLPLERTKMLLKWKNKYKEDATYQRLITCFDSLKRKDMVERVREIAAAPSCVLPSEFADHLKLWYAYTDPDPDVWPPIDKGKFFKPTIVRTEAGSSYNTDKSTNPSAKGGAIRKRVPIELHNIFDNKKETKKKQVILIEGAPGAGKSRLLWYMCQKWASGEMFQEFRLVIYIKFHVDSTNQPRSNIVDTLPETAWNEIKTDRGKGVLFLLDGLDELPQSLPENSIYTNILDFSPENALLCSTAVVTSCYISSDDLNRLAVSHLEVLGFGDQEVKECILDIMGDKEDAHQLMECLESRPSLLSSCHIPLNIMIITHVFRVKRNTLPSTMLETFKLLILNWIVRHIMKSEPEVEHEGFTSLENLPQNVQTSFDCLCELAFNGLKDGRAAFTSTEFHSIPDHLSLLHGTKVLNEPGPKMQYSFLHQTTQELLAGIHLSRMSPDDQLNYLHNFISQPRLHGMIQFYAGITSFELKGIERILCDRVVDNMEDLSGDAFISIALRSSIMRKRLLGHLCLGSTDYEILHSICEPEDNAVKRKLRSDESELKKIIESLSQGLQLNDKNEIKEFIQKLVQDPQSHMIGQDTLLIANCFYEANNSALYHLITGFAKFLIANIPLSPSDCLSLGCLIAQSRITHVGLMECKMTSKCINMLMQGLGKSFSIEALAFSSIEEGLVIIFCQELVANIKVKNLGLCSCTISSNGFTCILKSLKKCSIESLHFIGSDVTINESNGPMLQEFITSMLSLRSLDLTCNLSIGDIGAYYIGQALKNSTLELLNLSNCGITVIGALALGDGLEENKGLKELKLCYNDLGDDGIIAISQSLMLNSTVSVVNIDGCGFGEEGVKSLAGTLTCNTTIAQIVWTPSDDMNIEAMKEKLTSTGLLTPSAEAILFPKC